MNMLELKIMCLIKYKIEFKDFSWKIILSISSKKDKQELNDDGDNIFMISQIKQNKFQVLPYQVQLDYMYPRIW